jgi:hypothetical protein
MADYRPEAAAPTTQLEEWRRGRRNGAVVRWLWHNSTWTSSSHVERHSWRLGTPESELGGAQGEEEAGCRRCSNRTTTEEEEGLRSAVPTGLKAHVRGDQTHCHPAQPMDGGEGTTVKFFFSNLFF